MFRVGSYIDFNYIRGKNIMREIWFLKENYKCYLKEGEGRKDDCWVGNY